MNAKRYPLKFSRFCPISNIFLCCVAVRFDVGPPTLEHFGFGVSIPGAG